MPRVRSRKGRRKPALPSRSQAKGFNPSPEVRIVPKRASDGGETWEVVIARSAMQKLAKYAGVTEADLNSLCEPLKFMMFCLQHEKSDWATLPKRIEHLRKASSATCELDELLRPEWVAFEMYLFEDRELRQQMFGTRGVVDLRRADRQKAKEWMRASSELQKQVTQDVEAVRRIGARLSTMRDQIVRRPAPPSAATNPAKQYIATFALGWWTALGHGPSRTKNFIAFADCLYRLAGFKMRVPAIREQLVSAVKRA